MEQVGMDLGRRESQIAIITEAGELVEKRVRTERERHEVVVRRGSRDVRGPRPALRVPISSLAPCAALLGSLTASLRVWRRE
jgi:hypothetical protein